RTHRGGRPRTQRNAVGVGDHRAGTQCQAAVAGCRRTQAHGHGFVAIRLGVLARGDRIVAGGAVVVFVIAVDGIDTLVLRLAGFDRIGNGVVHIGLVDDVVAFGDRAVVVHAAVDVDREVVAQA